MIRTIMVTITALLPTAVLAEEGGVVIGGGFSFSQTYEGSKDTETKAIPFISFGLGRFTIGPDKVSYRVMEGQTSLKFSLGYGGERDADDLSVGGFSDIDNSALIGMTFAHDFGDAHAYADLNRYLSESEGASLTIGAGVRQQVQFDLILTADASLTYSNRDYMQSYFGVSDATAFRSGLDPYSAGSGFRRMDVKVGATYLASESVSINGILGLGYLLGDANDSPVVEDTTPVSLATFVTYRF